MGLNFCSPGKTKKKKKREKADKRKEQDRKGEGEGSLLDQHNSTFPKFQTFPGRFRRLASVAAWDGRRKEKKEKEEGGERVHMGNNKAGRTVRPIIFIKNIPNL